MYRYKKSIRADYNRQGYIYFLSRCYLQMPMQCRKRLRDHCRECAGEKLGEALFLFVTTNISADAVCARYFVPKHTLYGFVKKYYERFPQEIYL